MRMRACLQVQGTAQPHAGAHVRISPEVDVNTGEDCALSPDCCARDTGRSQGALSGLLPRAAAGRVWRRRAVAEGGRGPFGFRGACREPSSGQDDGLSVTPRGGSPSVGPAFAPSRCQLQPVASVEALVPANAVLVALGAQILIMGGRATILSTGRCPTPRSPSLRRAPRLNRSRPPRPPRIRPLGGGRPAEGQLEALGHRVQHAGARADLPPPRHNAL